MDQKYGTGYNATRTGISPAKTNMPRIDPARPGMNQAKPGMGMARTGTTMPRGMNPAPMPAKKPARLDPMAKEEKKQLVCRKCGYKFFSNPARKETDCPWCGTMTKG